MIYLIFTVESDKIEYTRFAFEHVFCGAKLNISYNTKVEHSRLFVDVVELCLRRILHLGTILGFVLPKVKKV